MAVNPFWIKLASDTHLALYRMSNGFIGSSMLGLPVLLLTTTGRRSGEPRTHPLMYLDDGDSYVVIGSNGGNTRHPAWYLNVREQPEAEVQVRADKRRVRAEELSGEERERFWQRAVEVYKGYDDYRRSTDRTIPVVRLRPVS